jgi:rhamnulokinase
MSNNYLAVDLGAESGRTIVGSLDGDWLSIEETHRFINNAVRLPDGLHWDVLRLWSDIKTGIAISSIKVNNQLTSIGLDTWGVDFALLDKYDALLSNPFHYRDVRTDGMVDEAFKRMTRDEIFAHTGTQFLQINTLYQLLAMSMQKSQLLDLARSFVTIPDLFNFWLSGQITNEFTNATTTQCLDPHDKNWSKPILEAMDLPDHLFRQVIEPGSVIGSLLPTISDEIGVVRIPIVAPACHDTGSAVVAVPAQNQNFAWISSGTWSILGAEVLQPSLSEKTLKYNFTNEGGVFGTWRLSKNIMGLWLLQESRREWKRAGEELSYEVMTRLAEESEAFVAVVDPDFSEFLHPGDMPARIQKFCADTGQRVPQTKGQIIRVALESIALKYRWVLGRLEDIIGYRLDPIHIIGGGIKNGLLNQFTANSTGRLVLAGPVEATAIGNILMQAISLKHLGSLSEARGVVQTSFTPKEYEPIDGALWDDAYLRFLKVMKE